MLHVRGRQILDSRGRPTVEVDVELRDGSYGRACAPSGASTGRHEALELRDGDDTHHQGRGVSKAVGNINGEIAELLKGRCSTSQKELDDALRALDGSENLSRLGANAIIATSLAICRAASIHERLPLHRYIAQLIGTTRISMPMPMANILSGGAHARRSMDFQDFLAVPVGAKNYADALNMLTNVRAAASELLAEDGITTLLADEGGLSPGYSSAEQAFQLMMRAFERAKLRPGHDIAIAVDVAASEFYHEGKYQLLGERRTLDGEEMVDFLGDFIRRYPLISIEDAFDQDDWSSWAAFTKRFPNVQIVGDDLFVTNPERISHGINVRAANAALIKVNQNGTLSGTFKAMKRAQVGGYATVVSARSGETEDSFIADLAVGSNAGQIKIGSVRNSERLGKYNQLTRISEHDDLQLACPFL
ncbi:phosphopyruvate hydratase [Allopusillimonas ginsengisoli]|nr:phosphopyruvate hydratase [Allopusillimonas ginsengisoli]